MGTPTSKEVFTKRVQMMKLRQAMKTLASVGLTPQQVIEYINDNGFDTKERQRKNSLSQHRQR